MNNADIIIKFLDSDPDHDSKSWKSHSLSYEKGILYSYSTAIGVRLKWKGKEYLVVSTSSYSCTTSRHKSELMRQSWRKYADDKIIHVETMSKWLDTGATDRSKFINWDAWKADLVEDLEAYEKDDPTVFANSWRREGVMRLIGFLHTLSRFINVTKEIARAQKLHMLFDSTDKIEGLIAAKKKAERDKAKQEKDERIDLIVNAPELAWELFLATDSASYIKDAKRTELKKDYTDFLNKVMWNRYDFQHSVESVLGFSIEFQRSYGSTGLSEVSVVSYRANTRFMTINMQDLIDAYDENLGDFANNFQAKFASGYVHPGDEGKCRFTRGEFDWTVDASVARRYHIPNELLDFLVPVCKHLKQLLNEGEIKNVR